MHKAIKSNNIENVVVDIAHVEFIREKESAITESLR